jgi:hypothetical protein
MSENLWWNDCIITYLYLCSLYVVICIVCCLIVIYLVYFALCYVLITRFIIRFMFVFLFHMCCFSFCVLCIFVILCVLFLLIYVVVSLLFVYKFTDLCHSVETQLQLINIKYHHTITHNVKMWHVPIFAHISQ